MRTIIHVAALSASILLAVLAWSGCDDTFVDPFDNDGRYYTVFGYMDVLEIDHVMRVIPITRQSAVIVSPGQPEAILDAEVYTTDMTSGHRFEWQHSLERFSDGTYGHFFRRSFTVQPGRTYRLDIERTDGITATAFTTVPHIPDSTFFNLGRVQFSDDSTTIRQEVHIPQISAPWHIEAIYRWLDGVVARRVFVPYGRTGSVAADGGWNVTLEISRDQEEVRKIIRDLSISGDLADDAPITLASVGLRIRMLNPDWDLPIDPLDPDIYAFPETLTNLQNGYGYFGSLGSYVQEWDICTLSGPLGYTPAEPECAVR